MLQPSSRDSYDMVWGIIITLGVFAALVNLPINEKAIVRRSVLAG